MCSQDFLHHKLTCYQSKVARDSPFLGSFKIRIVFPFIYSGQEHSKNWFGNPPEIIDKLTREILHEELDIKLGPFTRNELDNSDSS